MGSSQARPRAPSSGLATSTRPGRSGEDTRPGMTSGPQRKDFVIVPVPHKSTKVNVTSLQSSSVTVTSPPQQQSTLVPALELSSARVVPPSLFLTDTDDHQEPSNPPLELQDLPSDPPSTNPLDTADSIIDDSLGSTDDNASLHSDPDEPQLSDELPSDVVAADMNVADTALVNPREPRGPCAVTFGSIHDLHETHQGVSTKPSKNASHLQKVPTLSITHLAILPTRPTRVLMDPSSMIHCYLRRQVPPPSL